MQSVADLKARAEKADLYAYSTNEDRCDNCRFYKLMREDIGYCAHKELDMVVGGPWWCKLWEQIKRQPARALAAHEGAMRVGYNPGILRSRRRW